MKYVMLINRNDAEAKRLTPEQMQALSQEFMAFGKEAGGKILGGDRLKGPEEAVRVTVREGRKSVTDGPFSETKEVLAGYYLMDCADREEALQWAAKCPGARIGTMDVREVMNDGCGQPRAAGSGGQNGKQRWMFLILGEKNEQAWNESMNRIAAEGGKVGEEAQRRGLSAEGARLNHEKSGFQVRVRDGKRQVIDGPFAESKEVLGGYQVLEFESRDQAIEFASRHPAARFGSLQLIPTWPM
jgi:hypothetical protein